MKKYWKLCIFLIICLLPAVVVSASTYYILVDAEGYVVSLTAWAPAPPEYVVYEVGEIPGDVLRGYYKLVDGEFILDEAKKTEWEEANTPTATETEEL